MIKPPKRGTKYRGESNLLLIERETPCCIGLFAKTRTRDTEFVRQVTIVGPFTE
jgi:hypothetical protein